MHTEETTTLYYVCLNNRCPKHRAVFEAGDAEHEHCERKPLDLNEKPEHGSPLPLILTVAAVAAALIAAIVVSRSLVSAAKGPEREAMERTASDDGAGPPIF